MTEQKRFFDVWFVGPNTVYKEVPYHVVTDWVQQARLGADDMLKPSGTANWFRLSNLALFQPYLPQPDAQKVGDAAEALEPIEMDFNWRKRADDDDDDVDMIPLIDISLVLLIFFMMTTSVAAISRIAVPAMANGVKLDTQTKALRIDVDVIQGLPLYGLGKGTAAPEKENADLSDVTALMLRLEEMVKTLAEKPEVRIAAHGELPYSVVEKVMQELDKRRLMGLVGEVSIEVNEKQ
jgi:biopolymer transport protein ExbD